MKQSLVLLFVLLLAVCAASPSHAQFTSGSTGSDGAFSPTANTVLQVPPGGVFNFTTFNIPSGVTVSFARSASNDPVTILAQGNVTIAGTISVNGELRRQETSPEFLVQGDSEAVWVTIPQSPGWVRVEVCPEPTVVAPVAATVRQEAPVMVWAGRHMERTASCPLLVVREVEAMVHPSATFTQEVGSRGNFNRLVDHHFCDRSYLCQRRRRLQ